MFHKGKHSRKKTELISIAAGGKKKKRKTLQQLISSAVMRQSIRASDFKLNLTRLTNRNHRVTACQVPLPERLWDICQEASVPLSPSISQHLKRENRLCDYFKYITTVLITAHKGGWFTLLLGLFLLITQKVRNKCWSKEGMKPRKADTAQWFTLWCFLRPNEAHCTGTGEAQQTPARCKVRCKMNGHLTNQHSPKGWQDRNHSSNISC